MPIADPTSAGTSSRAARRAAQARARALAAKERERERREAREERKRKRKEERISSATHQVARREGGALPGAQTLGYEAGRPVTQASLRAIVRDEQRKARERAARLDEMGVEEAGLLGMDKELTRNYGQDIGEMAAGTGPGLLHMGDVLQHDIRELAGAPFRPDLRTLPGRGGETVDFRAGEEIIDPLIEQYRYTYLDRGPVIIGQDPKTGKPIYRAKDGGETQDPKKARRGIRAKIHENPLGPTFDLLGGLTVGGALVGRAGQFGLLGARARTLYEPGKLSLTTGQGGRLIDKTTSRNPVTRALQEQIRALTTNIAPKEARFIGEHSRAARVGSRQVRRTQRAEREAVVRDFDRSLSRLSKPERIAVALRGRGAVPSEEIIAIEKLRDADLAELRRLQEKKGKTGEDRRNIRRLRGQIGDHGALRALIAKVPDELYHRVLEDPKMRAAFEQGERVTEAGGDILKSAGFEFDREARLYLHQRVREGARYVEPAAIKVRRDEDLVVEERKRLGQEIQRSEKRITDLRVAVAAKRTPEAKARWREKLAEERERLAFLKMDLAAQPKLRGGNETVRIAGHEFVGGTPLDELEDLARRQTEEMGDDVQRLIFSSDVGAPLREGQIPLIRSGRGKMKNPGITKQNKATRILTSRWLPDPRVFKDSFIKAIAYVHAIQRGKFAFDTFGREVPLDGNIPKDGYYVLRPEAWMKKRKRGEADVKVSRADKERPTTRDRLNELMDGDISEDDILEGIKGHIATPDGNGGKEWIAEYGEKNVRWISKTEYNELFGDFTPASKAVRYILDNPTDFWRKLTLNYRPAWFVNNFVGQHLLYAMNHATPGGVKAYAEAVLNRHREGREDEFPEALRASGIYKEEQTQAGGFKAANNLFSRTAEGLGRFNTRYTDDLPRDAAWRDSVRKAKPFIDRIDGTNRTAQQLMRDLKLAGEGKLDNAFLKEQHDLLVQQVLDELIDFGNMSRAERSVIRRILPFYSWMKGITQATARMGLHNPAKTALLIAVAKEGNKAMEEWFGADAYSVMKQQFGVSKLGDIATTLSTQGLNPFQTIADNANFVKGLIGTFGEEEFYAKLKRGDFKGARMVGVERGVGFGSESPANAMGPVIQGVTEALTGRDLFSGEAVPAGIPGIIESGVRAFPQARVLQDMLAPTSALTKEGEPRLSQRGGVEIFGVNIPDSIVNYFGFPIKHKSLAGARRTVEDIRLEALPKDKRAIETLNKSFDKKLREENALAKKNGLVLNQTVVNDMRAIHRYEVAARLAEIADGVSPISKRRRAEVFVTALAAEKRITPEVATNLSRIIRDMKKDSEIAKFQDSIRHELFYAYYDWLNTKGDFQ